MSRIISFAACLAIIIINISCHEDEYVPPPPMELHFNITRHGSRDLFAGFPIRITKNLDPLDANRRLSIQLDFGDGMLGPDSAHTHIYQSSGTYAVKMVVVSETEKKEYSLDTAITVLPAPFIVGGEDRIEQAKLVYQDQHSNYKIVFTSAPTTAQGLTEDEKWNLLSLSKDLGNNTVKLLPFETPNPPFLPTFNKSQKLIAFDYHFHEVDLSGIVLQKTAWAGSWAKNIVEVNDGYYYANYSLDDVFIHKSSIHGERLFSKGFNVGRTGYEIQNVAFEAPDMVRIHYREKNSPYDKECKTLVWKRKIDGQTIFEKEYSFSQSKLTYKLSSGYLFLGPTTYAGLMYRNNKFIRVDDAGNILWTTEIDRQDLKIEYLPNGQAAVFEQGNFIYVFCNNMQGIKMDLDGNIIWAHRFTLPGDLFASAIINNAGNFVLLGTHLADYNFDESMDNEFKRDLILIEVNPDGQIVN